MKISFFNPYNNYNNYNSQPKKQNISFKSNFNNIYDKFGNVVNRNNTCFFRYDLNWKDFSKFLIEKYKDVDKVNIHNFACSDGSETYSLIMSLLENSKNPQEVNKFFPINATDLEERIILQAKSGLCKIFDSDIHPINRHANGHFSNYLNMITDSLAKMENILTEKVKFKQGNIIEDLNKLPDENNVILIRNCWPYIDSKHYKQMSELLQKKTTNNGVVVIGEFDDEKNIHQFLELSNFYETDLVNVFLPKK